MNNYIIPFLAAVSMDGGGLIGLLVHVLIVALVFGAIYYILTLIPLPAPFGQIVRIILGVIALIYVIYLLLGLTGTL